MDMRVISMLNRAVNLESCLLLKAARLGLSAEIIDTSITTLDVASISRINFRRTEVITPIEMSYNTNDLNQQWQPPVDPNNQQQLPAFNQQATPNPQSPDGGNYQQRQQSYTWTDGNTQGQHHSSQQSW